MPKIKKGIEKKCLNCKQIYLIYPYRKNISKFCSRKCKGEYTKKERKVYICPVCGNKKECSSSRYKWYIKNKSLCKLCHLEKMRKLIPPHTKERREKQRKLWIENNPGKTLIERKRRSERMKGDKNPAKRPEVRKKIREKRKLQIMKPWTDEARKNARLLAIKRGVKFPNHNPIGCDIIRWYNMYYGFNFQHAENGGEVCIDGYWPDGIDEKRKTIIEIDEPRHFNSDGTYKKKDIQRQNYLEGLGYKFIRIKV